MVVLRASQPGKKGRVETAADRMNYTTESDQEFLPFYGPQWPQSVLVNRMTVLWCSLAGWLGLGWANEYQKISNAERFCMASSFIAQVLLLS